MAIYRYTMFMNGDGAGASETYYFEEPAMGILQKANEMALVAAARAKMLPNGYVLKAHRVTLLEDPAGTPKRGISEFQRINIGVLNETGKESGPVDTSLKVKWRSEDETKVKIQSMWGIPRENNPRDDQFVATGRFQTAMNDFFAKLREHNPGWIVRTEESRQDVVDYQMDPSGIVTVQVGGNLVFPPEPQPKHVAISGVNGTSDLNGFWPVTNYIPVAPPGVTASFTVKTPIGVREYERDGVVRTFSTEFVALGALVDNQGNVTSKLANLGMGKRQRGKSFENYRGREAARPRA